MHAKRDCKDFKIINLGDYHGLYVSLYLKCWDVNNLYGWAISQKLPLNDIKWIEQTSQFNEDLIKIYNEDSDIGYFIEGDVQCPENLH